MEWKPITTFEEVTDPVECVEVHAQLERVRKNCEWLQANWSDVLPEAIGKYVAVAGQQAFIAETGPEARAMAEAAHPDDNGTLVQYVRPGLGPRIYGNRWSSAATSSITSTSSLVGVSPKSSC